MSTQGGAGLVIGRSLRLAGFTTELGRVVEALGTAVTAPATALDLTAAHCAAVDEQIGARLVPVSGPHSE